MLRVGLTGGIASGKTVVSDRLRELGAVVVDADLLAREVVQPETPAFAAIVQRFGEQILEPGGTLDRGALGRVVFADPEARRHLESIVHPAVRARANEIDKAAPADAIVVHVIPLLVETNQAHSFDTVVVVDIDPETQLQRLVARSGLTAADARARIAAQAGRSERLSAADHVLANGGTEEELRRQVDDLWRRLTS
ncbi:MAG TPA: dephospho-CoA kinase [Propionibacteriaceae bacterium]|jgi:dephospho-CoA kinase